MLIKTSKNNKKGFTLIELLVVIAIIGLLATISVVALNNSRARARDSRRASDIKQIHTALELYFNANDKYPDNLEDLEAALLMNPVPTAPTPADGDCDDSDNTYVYNKIEDKNYSLSYCLGNNTGGLLAGPSYASPAHLQSGGLSSFNCGDVFTDSRDGNTYATVQIGAQCWMAENLNHDDNVCSSATWVNFEDESWCGCYENDSSNCDNHGLLYQWSVAINICPTGWKLPSDEDWNVLENTVVGIINSPNPQYPCFTSELEADIGWKRCADDTGTNEGANGVGKALKETGLGFGDGVGTNLVGFNAKLPGARNGDGLYYHINSFAPIWTSTSYSTPNRVWYRLWCGCASTIARFDGNKANAFPVRCLLN